MFSAAEGPLVDGHVGERERREGQSEPAGLRREARRCVRVVVRRSGRLVVLDGSLPPRALALSWAKPGGERERGARV